MLQLCLTLCDPIDGSPPGSPIPGILQARTPEWVAIPFSNAWKWKVKVKSLSCVRLLATPWTAAHQAPPSMGFSRQEYWSGMPFRLAQKYLHFRSAEICYLILDYILNKCDYVIYHFNVHSQCFVNDLLLAIYFIFILYYGNDATEKANSSDFLIWIQNGL